MSNQLGMMGGLFSQLFAANMVASAAQGQANTIRVGGEIAAQGHLLTAAGFRESIRAVEGSLQFNLGVDALNNQRRLRALSRQSQRLLGRQTTQFASSGLSTTSRSFLQLRNESLDVLGRTLINFKVDAENKRRASIFEAEIRKTNLENQARASEYRAAAERVMAENRARQTAFEGNIAQSRAFTSVFQGLPTILG